MPVTIKNEPAINHWFLRDLRCRTHQLYHRRGNHALRIRDGMSEAVIVCSAVVIIPKRRGKLETPRAKRKEYGDRPPTASGPAEYVVFVGLMPLGAVEAIG
jgi:hypothetical protein